MASLVFGVSVHEVTTLVAGAALMALIARLASWLPARRAARLPPAESVAGVACFPGRLPALAASLPLALRFPGQG